MDSDVTLHLVMFARVISLCFVEFQVFHRILGEVVSRDGGGGELREK